jgi:hypothetical protein
MGTLDSDIVVQPMQGGGFGVCPHDHLALVGCFAFDGRQMTRFEAPDGVMGGSGLAPCLASSHAQPAGGFLAGGHGHHDQRNAGSITPGQGPRPRTDRLGILEDPPRALSRSGCWRRPVLLFGRPAVSENLLGCWMPYLLLSL